MHSKMLAMLETKDAAQESIMDAVRALSGSTKREVEASPEPAEQLTVAAAVEFLMAYADDSGLSIRITATCSCCDSKDVEIDPGDIIGGRISESHYCGGSPRCCP